MIIHLLPALEDNYMYLLEDTATSQVAVVDPVDADKVIEKVKELNLKLTKVLTTHHHWDHAGGNADLLNKFKETKLEVFGGDERIAGLTKTVKHDDLIKLGNLEIRCIATPCHTSGHICYYVEKPGFNVDPCVFTGDTLFVGGCGKFFEGTADQMCDALINKLSKLPDKTKVYCGHEYTVGNLKFAKSVEPNNQSVINKLKWAEEQRSKKEPTIPSTIGEEKSYNPFMRVNEESIKKAANHFEMNSIMKNLRQMKNNFSLKIF
ncbi:hypothetical protein RND71_043983 [Anisodus tanguticus]|uniref:hydroxyacylglutathione hydrolase n=1 Tax=Anisodus tanguticus TaxID=243964 RepID=A0AAE1UM11_9SOLA|nr:hypothetical protein RND71_043983 [Anisodus tanguticus]